VDSLQVGEDRVVSFAIPATDLGWGNYRLGFSLDTTHVIDERDEWIDPKPDVGVVTTISANNSTGSGGFQESTVVIPEVHINANVASIGVQWGTRGSAELLDTFDGRLLPAGRTNDINWSDINRITISLDRPISSLVPADISVDGVVMGSYGPIIVSGSGATWTLTLSKSITSADKVTLTIGNTELNSYRRQLDILPGDLNDDGVVSSGDVTLLNNASTKPYSLFADLNGDGVVDTNDGKFARTKIGSKRIL
jgi:hypothetical protein